MHLSATSIQRLLTLLVCVGFSIALRPCAAADTNAPAKKKVLIIAGTPSHGFGAHDLTAGSHLLKKCLNESGLPIDVTVHEKGWPTEEGALDGYDAIVMNVDGGDRHPVLPHLDEMQKLAAKGVGIGALHWGTEVPKGRGGKEFLDWIGGYFEVNWSVNPFWVADFKELPEHPVTRGVKPFAIKDEWYFHCRFPDDMKNVTPILTAVPPASTTSRPNGPHEGNDVVRDEVARGVPQHVMWVIERPDGGRGFGCTGGHVHWNWGNDQFRKLILNAICWIAKVDVPADGVSSQPLTVDDLLTHHDEPIPKGFDPQNVQRMLDGWRGARRFRDSEVTPAK